MTNYVQYAFSIINASVSCLQKFPQIFVVIRFIILSLISGGKQANLCSCTTVSSLFSPRL